MHRERRATPAASKSAPSQGDAGETTGGLRQKPGGTLGRVALLRWPSRRLASGRFPGIAAIGTISAACSSIADHTTPLPAAGTSFRHSPGVNGSLAAPIALTGSSMVRGAVLFDRALNLVKVRWIASRAGE
jgi:hypothetical protein